MDALIEWVTQIILFLLLASVVDLLIPATAMKKYIKLVVGLILILLLLQPIFWLFNVNIHQAVETAIARVEEQTESAETEENLIDLQKSEIQASQDAYILEQMAVQLRSLAEEPMASEHQAQITAIDFRFAEEEAYSFESLKEVIVHAADSEDREGTVSSVDEVVIDTDAPEASEEGQDTEEIKNLLRQVWELYDKEITIVWEGGTS
ncbi:stage III sporulation protein AF [Lentibacillus sediminis]|uniref:stage III sporulation protein AF n=1 Tax=Lentibacillus sediminis TaxID=1940529 RepID=UPI000C1C0275|nr:stage III sporulation protein AF [Lentibacillus sediminis]